MTAMDNTKLAADLCAIIDRMNEEEIAAVRRDYAQVIGEVST